MLRLADRFAVGLAVLVCLLLCAMSLMQSSVLLVEAPYDIYIPLDAGLRWLEGIMPSRDYPSPIGPLYAALHGLMLSFDSTDARSVPRADIVMLLLNDLLLWQVLRGLPNLTRATILILIAAMMMTPLALDSFWGGYRYVADYNRWAWGLFAVAVIWTYNPAARGKLAQLAVATALCCLLYLKLTLFVGAIAFMALGKLQGRQLRDYVTPLTAIMIALAIGIASGMLIPYLHDNIEISRATDPFRFSKLVTQSVAFMNGVVLVITCLLCLARSISWQRRVLLAVGMMIMHLSALQNHDLMIPLITLPLLLQGPQTTPADLAWFRPSFAKLPAFAHASSLLMVAVAALASQSYMGNLMAAKPVSAGATLGSKIAVVTAPENGPGIGADDLMAANAAILHQLTRAQDLLADLPAGTRVATLEFANIALAGWPRLRPAPKTLLWYQYQRSFSDNSYPAPRRTFAETDVILVPVIFTTNSTEKLVGLYRPWLDRCAVVIQENETWRLYRPIIAAPMPTDGAQQVNNAPAACSDLAGS